jgi:hypothetical protein
MKEKFLLHSGTQNSGHLNPLYKERLFVFLLFLLCFVYFRCSLMGCILGTIWSVVAKSSPDLCLKCEAVCLKCEGSCLLINVYIYMYI